jgi:LPS sulfotransferase NodH
MYRHREPDEPALMENFVGPNEAVMEIRPGATYFICCMPRSGSWLLADALRSTGTAGSPEEYFWDEFRESYLEQWGRPEIRSYPDFIKKTFEIGTSANGLFGAKLHWQELLELLEALRHDMNGQGSTLPAAQLLARYFPSPRYIYLYRVDVLRQAISWYRAARTADWYHVRGEEQRESPQIQANWNDVHALEQILQQGAHNWSTFFSNNQITPHCVVYEDMIEDYEKTVRDVLAFLDISCADQITITAPRLKPQRDDTTEEWVHLYLEARRRSRSSRNEFYGGLLQ